MSIFPDWLGETEEGGTIVRTGRAVEFAGAPVPRVFEGTPRETSFAGLAAVRTFEGTIRTSTFSGTPTRRNFEGS